MLAVVIHSDVFYDSVFGKILIDPNVQISSKNINYILENVSDKTRRFVCFETESAKLSCSVTEQI